MSGWVAGLLAMFVGAVFCFLGFVALRIGIALWGALAGFALGASVGGDETGVLGNALSWGLAIALAILFGAVAYLFYAVSIVLAMGSIGFTLGTSALVAAGVSWSWLIVLSGLALGVALAFVAIAGDLPQVVLIVLSATAGASAIVVGIMLITGTLDPEQITRSAAITEELDDWYWYAIWLVLAIAGIVAQVRLVDRTKATMREAWEAPRSPSSRR